VINTTICWTKTRPTSRDMNGYSSIMSVHKCYISKYYINFYEICYWRVYSKCYSSL